MIEKITEALQVLPPLPQTIQNFNKVYQNPQSDIEDFVQVIIQDPMLTANLLKVANSTIYGFTQKIKTLDQAIGLFGIKTVRTLIVSYELQKLFSDQVLIYGVSTKELSAINYEQAVLAASYASLDANGLSDEVFMSALLSDLGKILISQTMDKEKVFRQKLQDAEDIADVKRLEKEYLGAASEGVSAKMFLKWHFDTFFVEVLECLWKKGRYDVDVQKVAQIVWVVKTALNYKQKMTPQSIEKAAQLAKRFNLKPFKPFLAKSAYNFLKK
jgi:HD-like signal output (HDOD) protein